MAIKVIPGSLTDAYKKGQGDFSPDLVGFQFTKSASIFTLGNFSITTNVTPFNGQIFNSGIFSNPITLDSLQLTQLESQLLEQDSNTFSVILNNNKKNFLSYVYFGEAKKFIETELTDIIDNWKGSLYIQQSNLTNTIVGFNYNQYTDESYFSFPVSVVQNTFSLDTRLDGVSFDELDISVLQNDFLKYEIQNDFGKFPLLDYTGNSDTNDYIFIKVKGNVWPSLTATTNGSFTYHLRPTDYNLQKYFFNRLSDFQNQVLNRLIIPQYTLSLEIPYTNEEGYTFNVTQNFTWPTSDGYNLDVSGRNYGEYLENLFNLANTLDAGNTSIMTRRLVASSILEFDSAGDGTSQRGRKMDKLLKIWGREYDDVKRYIDGISFANVVTYDGVDNTPDELIKMMASTLGFDTIQSFSDNDLINYLATTTNVIFSGESRTLSIQEMDTELWRRLVINAWWLWKSKGTRKVIEFFLNLFNINECLIDLNEFVYIAESKLNYDEFVNKVTDYYGGTRGDLKYANDAQQAFVSLSNFPIDTDGYPKPLPDSPDYYFQMNGFWYDGGVPKNTKPDINGNNPHYGPYDFGKTYFDRFRCFIDGFVFSSETVNLNQLSFNYFTDYGFGTVEPNTGVLVISGETVSTGPPPPPTPSYGLFYGSLMNDTDRITSGSTVELAGKTDEYVNTGKYSIKINFNTGKGDECIICPPSINLSKYNPNSGVVTYIDGEKLLGVDSKKCCDFYGYYTYPQEDSTELCYWCPPPSTFINFDGPLINGVYFKGPNSKLIKPSKECCTLRGFAWNSITKKCVPKADTTIDYVEDDSNFAVE
jgi:hypothetical protein